MDTANGFTEKKTASILRVIASGEVTATPVDTYKEVHNADN